MKYLFRLGCIVFVISLNFVYGMTAATVDGYAYKDDVSDHSGITIILDSDIDVPTIGKAGLILLLVGMGFLIFYKRRRIVLIPILVIMMTGLSFVTYALVQYSTTTNSLGEYDFADVEPGDYSVDASAFGYHSEHIDLITIEDGGNTLPDITLYPSPPSAGDLVSTDPIVGNMRYAPNGTFTQGSPDGLGSDPEEPCRGSDETQFEHTLTRNIAVMETEVTRQMWADLLAERPSLPEDPSSTAFSPSFSYPVQQNTWYEAVLFANLLSIQNSYTPCYYRDSEYNDAVDATNYTTGPFYCDFDADGYRLPTEGECEYFTRAGSTTAFSCNETNYTSENCFSCNNEFPTLEQYCLFCEIFPNHVGSKLGNPWNLRDVHGNVWEWCWDWYGTYPTGPETDYEGPSSGVYRVRRGAGCFAQPLVCRSAHRDDYYPFNGNHVIGFRLVRTIN